MGKYLSKDIVVAAYRELAHLTDKPSAQGQTQRASALRYIMALSRFAYNQQRDFDIADSDDKKLFCRYVDEIVSLGDGWSTRDFYDKFTNTLSEDINSNFYSAGSVEASKETDREVDYPRRTVPCFRVKSRKALIRTINGNSISFYLRTKALGTAFVIWLSRNTALPSDLSEEDLMPTLKGDLSLRYTKEVIDGLWKNTFNSIREFNSTLRIFDDSLSKLSREDLGYQRQDVASAKTAGEETKTVDDIKLPRNVIFFGAPGTGKSYLLNKLASEYFEEDNVHRVTFYPDYAYSQFVGGYKPFPRFDEEGVPTGDITYDFVPGPFLRTYVQAVQNPDVPYLLIIEEINRANAASVFGDLFQLLDRDEGGRSVYDLSAPVEMQLYLRQRIPEFHTNNHMGAATSEHCAYIQEEMRLFDETMRLSIPSNMYIWATMNSADQGVFPMDTAFKRRWNFKYIGINEEADIALENGQRLSDIAVEIQADSGDIHIVWDKLRRKINDLLKSYGVNEDKFLGPFFISPDDLESGRFIDVFKNKVLLYLYEDISRMSRGRLFVDETATYSELCEQFAHIGVAIFKDIQIGDVAASVSSSDSFLDSDK